MSGRTWQTFGALVLGSIALGAQQPPPAPLPEIGASIDVRVVNVEVVAADRKGNRVEGLKAADFRLLVDGREVPVDYFTEVRGGQAVASPAAAPAAPAAEAPAAAPASPVPAGPVGMSYLVFIDESFAVAAQRDSLLQRLADDLRRIGPEDRMAVVAFDGHKIDLLSDWTGDRDVLRRTFQQARSRPSQGIKRLVDRRQDEEDQGVGEDGLYVAPSFLDVEIRSAAEAAAAAMRGISTPPAGRKALLLLTSGWAALEPYGLGPSFLGLPSAADLVVPPDLFEPVTATANLLGYTIYPVLTPTPVAETHWADASQAAPTPFVERGLISSPWDLGVNEAMHTVAYETGGVPIFNSRQSALARVEKDTRSYYWLGFTPEWRADGRSHQIQVEVRRPGLEVRSRTGFTDLSKTAQASLRTDNLLLFGNGADVQPIQVETGEPRRTGLLSVEVPVTLLLPADLLTPLPVAGGGYEVRARLAMTSLDRWGGKTEHRDLELRMKLPAVPKDGDLARYRTHFNLRKLDQHLVFAVQDEVGDGQGRAEVDFKP